MSNQTMKVIALIALAGPLAAEESQTEILPGGAGNWEMGGPPPIGYRNFPPCGNDVEGMEKYNREQLRKYEESKRKEADEGDARILVYIFFVESGDKDVPFMEKVPQACAHIALMDTSGLPVELPRQWLLTKNTHRQALDWCDALLNREGT